MDTTSHPTERSDTCSVSVAAPPRFVWGVLSAVTEWPAFSPFATAVRATSPTTFEVDGPHGRVQLTAGFVEELLLLDHTVTLPDGTAVLIPYRVAPNHLGSELIMTNVKSPGDTDAEYEDQLRWMRTELDGARLFVEERYRAGHDAGA
jgi:hypothetical protein